MMIDTCFDELAAAKHAAMNIDIFAHIGHNTDIFSSLSFLSLLYLALYAFTPNT